MSETTADVAGWLDRLEQAHAAATPGTIDDGPPFIVGDTEQGEADAAAIVAEHNATPQLVAAIRAVLALHVRVDAPVHPQCQQCTQHGRRAISPVVWPCPTVRAVTAALGATGGEK